MTPDRQSILQFLSRRREDGASLRDLLQSLEIPPHERRHVKRLLQELTRDGLIKLSGSGKFRVASGSAPRGGNDARENAPRDNAPRGNTPRASAPTPRANTNAPRTNGSRNGNPDIATLDDFGPDTFGANDAEPGNDDAPPPRDDEPGDADAAWRVGGKPRATTGKGGRGGWRTGGSSGKAHSGRKGQPAGAVARPSTPTGDDKDWRGMRRPKAKKAPVATASGVVTGRFTRNPKGFGFVQPLDKSGPDVFIPPDAIGSALHGDIVDARVTGSTDEGARRSGRIVGVRERSRAGIPGRYESRGKNSFVVPDDRRHGQDVWISKKDHEGARDGDLVLVEVIAPPQKDFFAKGKVVKILGDREDPGIDADLVIGEFGVQVDFSPGALAEAGAFPEEIDPEERRRRRDLSHVPFVTIDGLTAKDFDDAVAVEELGAGKVRLYVAIADVAHYVRKGTPLDEDASERVLASKVRVIVLA